MSMDYKDIIQQNIDRHVCPSWWCKYAFHFTDVSNAASILTSGKLYSRSQALNLNVMSNDNASRQVIDITDSEVISNVRFYFRPKTPTQYYNEGFKHPQLRYHDDTNANVPVPVFFLFDLEKLMSHPHVEFSELSQAGHGAKTFKGVEAFSRLKFEYIYNNAFDDFQETKRYRQAEILIPNYIDIENYLSYILCRNSLERMTLLKLLERKPGGVSERYENRIRVYKEDVFFDNGISINACEYKNNCVYLSPSDSYACYQYNNREKGKRGLEQLNPIDVCVYIEWKDDSELVLNSSSYTIKVDVHNTKKWPIISLPTVAGATKLGIKVFIEGKLMCYVIHSLLHSELLE